MNVELSERLDLIERMIHEGRSSSYYYGWISVVGGAVMLAAYFWEQAVPGELYPWPVVMGVCGVIHVLVMKLHPYEGKTTFVTRALTGLWAAMGLSMFLIGFLGPASRAGTPAGMRFVLFVLLGCAYAASGHVLRWRLQQGCALLWWGAGIALLYLSGMGQHAVFAAAVLVGMVLLGLYLMILERRNQRHGTHA